MSLIGERHEVKLWENQNSLEVGTITETCPLVAVVEEHTKLSVEP